VSTCGSVRQGSDVAAKGAVSLLGTLSVTGGTFIDSRVSVVTGESTGDSLSTRSGTALSSVSACGLGVVGSGASAAGGVVLFSTASVVWYGKY
jgi:hypothetical protein